MRPFQRRWPAWPVLVALLAASGPAYASPEPTRRDAEVPLAVGPGPGPGDMSEAPADPDATDTSEGPAPPGLADSVQAAPRTVPSPTAVITDVEPTHITIAVGLGPSAPGSKSEKAIVDALGIKPRFAFAPLRTAISGRRVSPPLFESMEILGKDSSIARLAALRDTLA